MRHLPNIISLARVPLGVIIALLVLRQAFALAHVLFVLGFASDVLDGYIARKYNWLSRYAGVTERLGDASLVGGPMIALAKTGRIPGGLWTVAVLAIVTTVAVLAGLTQGQSLVGKIGRVISPIIYISVALGVSGALWLKGYSGGLWAAFGAATFIAGLGAAYYKRDRFQAWIQGQY